MSVKKNPEAVRIGHLLQEARKSKDVLQEDLCEPCGLSHNHISATERGVSMPSIKTLLGYCDTLHMTPDEILGYDKSNIRPDLRHLLSQMSDAEQQKIIDMIHIMQA